MRRIALTASLLAMAGAAVPLVAQTPAQPGIQAAHSSEKHAQHGGRHKNAGTAKAQGECKHHHAGSGHHAAVTGAGSAKPHILTEGGQAAFATIGEAIAALEADPATDWSKVNIDALRDHLVDMDNVATSAKVASVAVEGGMRFDVTGEGAVRDSIQRMVSGHARMMDGAGGRKLTVVQTPGGASMTVTADRPEDAVKIKSLGFFGLMADGDHHHRHHLMLARGGMPH